MPRSPPLRQTLSAGKSQAARRYLHGTMLRRLLWPLSEPRTRIWLVGLSAVLQACSHAVRMSGEDRNLQ